MSTEPPVTFRYAFTLSDGEVRTFEAELDPDTLALRASARQEWPRWTRLGYFQCANCPLSEARHPRCPIAASLADLVEAFGQRASTEMADVRVEGWGRVYTKRVPLAEALSALAGILTVTSGCPVLNKLRPMVATHLPFMNAEESAYRVVSMYLMAQHFVARGGGDPDWRLQGLVDFLAEARVANAGLIARLASLDLKDALLNALTALNALGEITSMSIVDDRLERWRRVFAEHYGRR